MTNAPEQIWVQRKISTRPMSGTKYGGWHSESSGHHRETKYIRTDLYDALKAENERLRYVLGVIHEATATGDGLTPDECIDVHLRARAAFEGDG